MAGEVAYSVADPDPEDPGLSSQPGDPSGVKHRPKSSESHN